MEPPRTAEELFTLLNALPASEQKRFRQMTVKDSLPEAEEFWKVTAGFAQAKKFRSNGRHRQHERDTYIARLIDVENLSMSGVCRRTLTEHPEWCMVMDKAGVGERLPQGDVERKSVRKRIEKAYERQLKKKKLR